MTVSQRIFTILDEKKMTQKEFSEKTGIPQSTISDWRKKNTNSGHVIYYLKIRIIEIILKEILMLLKVF